MIYLSKKKTGMVDLLMKQFSISIYNPLRIWMYEYYIYSSGLQPLPFLHLGHQDERLG